MLRPILLCIAIVNIHAFPQGAPPEACESLSPERGHGVKSQPVDYAPFTLIQHSSAYSPGQHIDVEIIAKDPNVEFKGFLVQALDANTYEYIGEFVGGEGMQVMKECAAVTHSDPKPKNSANLIWQSPQDKEGHVMFRATIVVKRDTYFANIISQAPPQQYAPLEQDTPLEQDIPSDGHNFNK